MGNSASGINGLSQLPNNKNHGVGRLSDAGVGSLTADTRRASAVHDELCQMLINKSKNHDVGDDHISKKTFLRYFHSERAPDFAVLLYDHICQTNFGRIESDSQLSISREAFSKFCKGICNLIRDCEQLKFYTTLFAQNKQCIDRQGVEDLFRICFLLEAEMIGCKYACDADNQLLISIVEAISLACIHQEKSVTNESLQAFLRKYFAKVIYASVHRWLVKRVGIVQTFPSNTVNTDSNGTKFKSAVCHGSSSGSTNLNSHRNEDDDQLLHPVLVWFFAHTLPALYTKPKQVKLPSPVTTVGQCLFDYHEVLTSLMKFSSTLEWELLYSNSSHGSSINRFQHHVFSYRGPTAMIVKTDGDVMLCVAIDHEWRERVSRWGGDQCIVMQITPCFKIFEAGEKLIYFNLTTRGYPFGLHVGRNPKSPVLEIDQDLCVAKVKKIPYKLEVLEIWGCADKEIREKQIEQKKWEMDQAEKHKKVNRRAVDWNENPDRYILELAGRPSYGANFKR